ncbi:MAG: helix-turn-helix domain-containing protein [Pseudomonadota bacterium]
MRSSGQAAYLEPSELAWLPTHNVIAEKENEAVSPTPQEVHSLSNFDPAERLDAWKDALCETFTELLPETVYDNPFSGLIETVDCAGIRISRITADAQRVHRGNQEIERARSDLIYLNVHVGGSGRVLHQFGTTELSVGDCVLVDPSQPYVLEFGSSFRQLCVQLPAWSLRERIQVPLELALGKRLSLVNRSGKVLRSALELMLTEASTDVQTNTAHADLFMHVLNYSIIEALRPSTPDSEQNRASSQLIARLRQYLASEFRNVDISPASAADRLGCSVRNIHKICRNEGTTFGKLLLDARLSAVARILASGQRTKISELAFDCGFNDISHFNKVFRARFGESPTAFRSRRN